MTTARGQIENLTNTWYGYAVCSAGVGLLSKGIGLFSILGTTVGLLFSLGFIWFLGRRLMNKGQMTRWLLIAASGLFTCLGTWGAAQSSWAFVHNFAWQDVVMAVSSAVSAWMMAKSFRVLTGASVKQYFA